MLLIIFLSPFIVLHQIGLRKIKISVRFLCLSVTSLRRCKHTKMERCGCHHESQKNHCYNLCSFPTLLEMYCSFCLCPHSRVFTSFLVLTGSEGKFPNRGTDEKKKGFTFLCFYYLGGERNKILPKIKIFTCTQSCVCVFSV